jgi:hypothetical protein
MGMHRFVALAAACLGVCFAGSAAAEKSAITTTAKGHDLEVVVHGVTDYCSTNAGTEIIRRGDSIRIIRERPSKVSRCLSSQDVTITVKDVPSGTYRVTYEQIPLVAPARALTLASATAIVE